MTTLDWRSGTSGAWSDAQAWSLDRVPDGSDGVTIAVAPQVAGLPYGIALQGNAAVRSVAQTQPDSTLAVSNGTLSVVGTYALAAGTLSLNAATLAASAFAGGPAGTILCGSGTTLANMAIQGTLHLAATNPGASLSHVSLAGDSFAAHGAAFLLDRSVLATLGQAPALNNLAIALNGASLLQAGGTLTLGAGTSVAASGDATLGSAGGDLLNAGLIGASGAADLTIDAAGFTNQGSLLVGAGATLQIDAAKFSNPGTISVVAGATLDIAVTASGGVTNAGSIALAGGTLKLDAALTTSQLAAFPVQAGTLAIGGTLDNTGAILRTGSGTTLPNIVLQGGTITGGTIVNTGGLAIAASTQGTPGLLDGVTVQGLLELAGAGAQLDIAGGFSATGVAGAGGGALAIDGQGATLTFLGDQTLDDATILLGSDTAPAYYADSLVAAAAASGAPATLTLGPSVTVVQTGRYGTLGGIAGQSLVVNRGTISAASSDGSLLLASLANQNLIAVADGGQALLTGVTNAGTIADTGGRLTVQGALVNTGTIALSGVGATYDGSQTLIAGLDNRGLFSVSNGATAVLGTVWSNTGTFLVSNAALSAGGHFTTAQLGRVVLGAGGTLGIAGTLIDTGTLSIGAGTELRGVALLAGGTIQGGTIKDAGGGLLAQGGTLSATTYQGTLAVASGDQLTVSNGFSVVGPSGTGGIVLDGTLLAGTTETLDHVAIALGAGALLGEAAGQTLTLGAHTVVSQTGTTAHLGTPGGAIVNQGAIVSGLPAGTLTLAGTLTNAGTIAASHGATLVLDLASLTNAGVISAADSTVDIVRLTAAQLAMMRLANSQVDVTGTLSATGGTLSAGQGGTIPLLRLAGELVGGTLRDTGGGVQFVGASTLDGVAYQGALVIDRPFSTVTAAGGLTVTDTTGAQPGTVTLSGAGASLVWGSAQAFDRATLAIGNASALYGAPALLAASMPVTLGAHLLVRHAGTYATIGGAAGTLTSAGIIGANLAHGQLALGGDRFTNTGTIGISNTDTVTATAGGFLNAGLIVIGTGSALDLSLLDYFRIGSLAAASFTNAGTIQMAGGILAEITDNGAFPNVPLLNAAGGRLVGAGVVASQIDNEGTIEARGGVLNLVQKVGGTGTLKVDPGAMLVLGGVGAGQTATFGGAGGVLGLQPAYFLGSIDSFGVGDTLDLFNTAARAARFSGSSIEVTLTTGATLHLATTASLIGDLNVTAGLHGDSLIRLAAAPVNAAQTAPIPGLGTAPHIAAPGSIWLHAPHVL